MSMTAAIFATLLPWVAGWCWMRRLYPGGGDAVVALQVGYGFFVGILATALGVRLLTFSGIGVACVLTGILLVASAVVCFQTARRGSPDAAHAGLRSWWGDATRLQRALLVALAGLISLHAGLVAIEAWTRPLYAWDAWMNWAPKAKVWTELGEYLRFGSRQEWLATGGDIFTMRAWHYPEFVPLVETWVATIAGGWHDRAVNLPWLGAYFALLAGVYGQTRRLGYDVTGTVALVCLLATLPVLNIQVALPGYADLWLGAFFGLSTASLLVWAKQRNPVDLGMALLLWVTLAWIKIPGTAWMAVLLPAIAAALLPMRAMLMGLAGVGVAGLLVLAMGGINIPLPGDNVVTLSLSRIEVPLLGAYTLDWQGVGGKFLAQIMADPAWHLAFYLLPAALAIGMWRMPLEPSRFAGILVILGSMAFIVLALLFTKRSGGVEAAQTTHRAFLHAMPAMLAATAALLAPQNGVNETDDVKSHGLSQAQPAARKRQ